MQFDFKEKAKKRQDRNSPIKPLFCIQFENPSKVSWGEFQISMGFVQPPRSAPIFASPHESLVTLCSLPGEFYFIRRFALCPKYFLRNLSKRRRLAGSKGRPRIGSSGKGKYHLTSPNGKGVRNDGDEPTRLLRTMPV